eukprot:COSAG02_NODE_12249_length_1573_cov_1.810719_2_plen_118_part_00
MGAALQILGIFMLPGGAVLLAAKLLPFDLFTSAFSSKQEVEGDAEAVADTTPEPQPEFETKSEREPESTAACLGQPPEGTGPKSAGSENGAELCRGSTLMGTTAAGNMGDDEDMCDD